MFHRDNSNGSTTLEITQRQNRGAVATGSISGGTKGRLSTNLLRHVVEYNHTGRLTRNGLRSRRFMSLRHVSPGRYRSSVLTLSATLPLQMSHREKSNGSTTLTSEPRSGSDRVNLG